MFIFFDEKMKIFYLIKVDEVDVWEFLEFGYVISWDVGKFIVIFEDEKLDVVLVKKVSDVFKIFLSKKVRVELFKI